MTKNNAIAMTSFNLKTDSGTLDLVFAVRDLVATMKQDVMNFNHIARRLCIGLVRRINGRHLVVIFICLSKQ